MVDAERSTDDVAEPGPFGQLASGLCWGDL